ncbi:MAG: acylphosphatase [Candidatus Micrarchaeia archaeon]
MKARLLVSGKVQGVGFRMRTQKEAAKLGLKGLVRNTPTGRVEVFCEGEKEKIQGLVQELRKPHRSWPLPESDPHEVKVFFKGEKGFSPVWKGFQGFEIDFGH